MSTRAQILAEIAAQFPDNTSGAITPAKLRQVVEDIANSYNNSTDEPAQPLDADLTAIAGLSTPGILARTNSGTAAARTVVGTANQVIVTNGDGVSGNPTLSLPQSIAPTSTPQFAKLGVGMAAPSDSIVSVQHSSSGAGGKSAVIVTGSLTAPESTDLHPDAYRDSTVYTSTVAADAYASYDAKATVTGSQAYNHLVGFQARSIYSGSSSLDLAAMFSAQMTHSGSGTVTTAIGAYMQDPLGTGSITHNYGVYVGALTRGTNNWAFYNAGSAPSYLGGPLTVDSGLTAGGLPAALTNSVFRVAAPNSSSPAIEGIAFGSTALGLRGRLIGGTRTSPSATPGGSVFFNMSAFGHDGTSYQTGNNATYAMVADGTWSGTSHGVLHQWTGTSSGATTAAAWMILQNGNLSLPRYGAGTLVTDSSGNVTASSDASLKNVTGDFTRGLEDVLKLTPRTYHWNEKSGMDIADENVGFVAQEVLEAIPEAVGQFRTTEAEVDGKRVKTREKAALLTLSDRPIIAALVNAVKELSEQNAALVKRIAALEMAKK